MAECNDARTERLERYVAILEENRDLRQRLADATKSTSEIRGGGSGGRDCSEDVDINTRPRNAMGLWESSINVSLSTSAPTKKDETDWAVVEMSPVATPIRTKDDNT